MSFAALQTIRAINEYRTPDDDYRVVKLDYKTAITATVDALAIALLVTATLTLFGVIHVQLPFTLTALQITALKWTFVAVAGAIFLANVSAPAGIALAAKLTDNESAVSTTKKSETEATPKEPEVFVKPLDKVESLISEDLWSTFQSKGILRLRGEPQKKSEDRLSLEATLCHNEAIRKKRCEVQKMEFIPRGEYHALPDINDKDVTDSARNPLMERTDKDRKGDIYKSNHYEMSNKQDRATCPYINASRTQTGHVLTQCPKANPLQISG